MYLVHPYTSTEWIFWQLTKKYFLNHYSKIKLVIWLRNFIFNQLWNENLKFLLQKYDCFSCMKYFWFIFMDQTVTSWKISSFFVHLIICVKILSEVYFSDRGTELTSIQHGNFEFCVFVEKVSMVSSSCCSLNCSANFKRMQIEVLNQFQPHGIFSSLRSSTQPQLTKRKEDI